MGGEGGPGGWYMWDSESSDQEIIVKKDIKKDIINTISFLASNIDLYRREREWMKHQNNNDNK